MNNSARTEDMAHAFAWAQAAAGGEIVARERHARWRPTWSLDVKRPDGEVIPLLLRGFRDPIAEDDRGVRERLRKEAGICAALQGTGVKVPRYFGHEPVGGWMLMERVSGDALISKVEDRALQARIFREYMENIALMHRLDWRELDLPDNIAIARTYEESVTANMKVYRAPYENYPHKDPEPLFELCLWWFDNHKPKPVDRFSVTTGDIGADQFLFEDGHFKCIFDLEMGYVGDPLQDIGLMRFRNLDYPIADINAHIRRWAELTGRELDKESVCYWTLQGMIAISPMFAYPQWVKPTPSLVAAISGPVFASIPIHRRGAAESLAEYYDVALTPPEQPKPLEDWLTRYHEALAGQIGDFHIGQADSSKARYALQCSAALAETALLCNTIGPELERQNVADLARLLGRQPATARAGLAALQERIKADPERDLERVIQTLYAVEARLEFLLSPNQRFTGYATGASLQRMW